MQALDAASLIAMKACGKIAVVSITSVAFPMADPNGHAASNRDLPDVDGQQVGSADRIEGQGERRPPRGGNQTSIWRVNFVGQSWRNPLTGRLRAAACRTGTERTLPIASCR
jgi:hypothetical protein